MKKKYFDMSGVKLDSNGRVELNDEQLRSVEADATLGATAGGANDSCGGTANTICTNTVSCGESSNAVCTNQANCNGAYNWSCTNQYASGCQVDVSIDS